MEYLKDLIKPPYSSTAREIRRFSKSKWIQARFLPTPGLDNSLGSQPNSIPSVHDWRFSPSGRTGVSVVPGNAFDVLLFDVHNKLWFGHTIKNVDLQFRDIFTYHMLDETTLVLVEIPANNLVKQHIVNVNLETRKAEFIRTVVHEFRLRYPADPELPLWVKSQLAPAQHVPLRINRKNYTALISSRNTIGSKRIVFLVPRYPESKNVQPMEFCFSTELSTADQDKLKRLTGSTYLTHDFCLSAMSSAGLLHLTPSIAIRHRPIGPWFPIFRHVLLGVYLTVDVTKLTDIHNQHIGNMDQMSMDQDQADATQLIVYPFVKLVECVISFSCGLPGSLVALIPYTPDQSKRSYYQTCHVLESQRTLQIKTTKESWLNLHPCGAVLQFTLSPSSRLMYVRVASIFELSLSAIANSKVLFQPNRPLESIEGLHQMVFDGLRPIPLDETANAALGSYTEYRLFLRGEQDSSKKRKEPIVFEVMKSLPRPTQRTFTFLEDYENRRWFALGVVVLCLAVLQIYLIQKFL